MCVYESLEKCGPRNELAELCLCVFYSLFVRIYGGYQSSEPYDGHVKRTRLLRFRFLCFGRRQKRGEKISGLLEVGICIEPENRQQNYSKCSIFFFRLLTIIPEFTKMSVCVEVLILSKIKFCFNCSSQQFNIQPVSRSNIEPIQGEYLLERIVVYSFQSFLGYFRNSLSDGCWTRTAISLLKHWTNGRTECTIDFLFSSLCPASSSPIDGRSHMSGACCMCSSMPVVVMWRNQLYFSITPLMTNSKTAAHCFCKMFVHRYGIEGCIWNIKRENNSLSHMCSVLTAQIAHTFECLIIISCVLNGIVMSSYTV